MRTLLTTLMSLCALLSLGSVAHAQTASQDLTVTPMVIDEKAKARDILKETVMLKNTSNHKLELYPSVNNIDRSDGKQQFSVAEDSQALSDSLANWIELSRGVVELSPGEEKSVPFIIRINLNAVSNDYHAQISFTEGETRAEADARGPIATVMVNVEVQRDSKELLQLNKYSTDNVFFSGDDVLFNYQLENIGNEALQPKGQIRIYDRKGQEIADVDVNKDGKVISPEQVAQLASVWSAADGFGKYKALLSVNYGSSQTASVQDTVFFWVVPWKQVLFMLIITLIAVGFLSLQFHNWLERRHLYKFAHAGLLNDHTLKKMDEIDPEPVPLPPQEPTPAASMLSPVAIHIPQKPMVAPAPVVAPRPAVIVEPQQHKEHRSLRDVLKKETHAVQTHSINLKDLRATEPDPNAALRVHIPQKKDQVESSGHVISLKKRL